MHRGCVVCDAGSVFEVGMCSLSVPFPSAACCSRLCIARPLCVSASVEAFSTSQLGCSLIGCSLAGFKELWTYVVRWLVEAEGPSMRGLHDRAGHIAPVPALSLLHTLCTIRLGGMYACCVWFVPHSHTHTVWFAWVVRLEYPHRACHSA